MTAAANSRRTPHIRDPLDSQRLWIVAAGWVLLLAVLALLLLKAPWIGVMIGIPLLMPPWWLFALHLIGQKPPASLLRLDIAGLARHVLGEAKAAALRGLNAVPVSEGNHLPKTQAAGNEESS